MNDAEAVSAPQLTEAHLQRHPVWQFNADHEDAADESQLTPVPGLPPDTWGSFIVSATFTLENGRELPGAVQVDSLGTKLVCTPAFIWAGGKGVEALGHDTALRLARLTKASGTRPLAWQLAVAVGGELTPRRGRIARFQWLQAFGLVLRLISLRFRRRR
ncbi:MAG: hypothetical protein RLZZ618_943 [Pseudomonadota bacterium]|jgi:hypothetical protein